MTIPVPHPIPRSSFARPLRRGEGARPGRLVLALAWLAVVAAALGL